MHSAHEFSIRTISFSRENLDAQTFMCSQNPLRFCPVNTIYTHKSTTIKNFSEIKIKCMK